MKLFAYAASLVLGGSLLAACSTDTDEARDTNLEEETIEQEETTGQSDEPEEAAGNSENPEETEGTDEEDNNTYSEEMIEAPYALKSTIIFPEENNTELLALSFHRSDEDSSRETRLMESFIASDLTSNQVLSGLQEVRIVEETEAELVFTEENQLTSLASTEQTHLTDMLHSISHLYGISTIRFFVDDEPGIMYGQTGDIELIRVETEENRGYYLINSEAEENAETLYISGYKMEEDITDEQGELLSFAETVEAMKSTHSDGSSHESAIPEGLQILDVQTEGEEAELVFDTENMQDKSEEVLNQFETALQLTALDFNLTNLKLVNETEKTIKTFTFDKPSAEEQEDEAALPSGEEKTSYQNARFGFSIEYPEQWNEGEEADNGDGLVLHDTESDSIDIRVFGRHQIDSNPSDIDEYDTITLADGKEAYFQETSAPGLYLFEVIRITDDTEYLITGEVTAAFYEENEILIEEMIMSFETAE